MPVPGAPGVATTRLGAWAHRHGDRLFDVLLVVGLLLGTLVTLRFGLRAGVTSIHDRPPAPTSAVTLLATAMQAVPLLWRRRHPVAVLAAVWAATVAVHLLNAVPGPASFGLLIALHGAAALSRTRRALAVSAGVALAGTVADFAVIGRDSGLLGLAVLSATYGAFWVAGAASRARRLHAERLEEEAGRAERAAARERLRLAREVHDAVTTQVTAMVVQADAGRVRLREAPEQVPGTLDDIARTGRRALDELRGVLGLLRGTAPAPPARLSEGLDALVERARAAGSPVELRRGGALDDLPEAVDTAAHRVVQEALTNAVRHAGGRPVTVVVERVDDQLLLEVGNPLPAGVPRGEGGYGLLGMAERADLLGGTLRAGPDGDRFVVRARLPVAIAAVG